MTSEIVLKDWESNDFMLDDDLIFDDHLFKYVNEVKIFILKNKLNHKFLNKLCDTSKISDNDYHYLMDWYYTRKTYIDTPETREEDRIFFEQREKEAYEMYQETLKLLEK